MRFLNYLNEEYFGTLKVRWEPTTTVFKNPDDKEVREACASNYNKSCRFMLDLKNKDLYVWNAEVLHQPVSTWLEKNGITNVYPYDPNFNNFWGEANLASGKLATTFLGCYGLRNMSNTAKVKSAIKGMSFADKWFKKGYAPADEALSRVMGDRLREE